MVGRSAHREEPRRLRLRRDLRGPRVVWVGLAVQKAWKNLTIRELGARRKARLRMLQRTRTGQCAHRRVLAELSASRKFRRVEAKTDADPSLAYPICDGAPKRSLRDDNSKLWGDEWKVGTPDISLFNGGLSRSRQPVAALAGHTSRRFAAATRPYQRPEFFTVRF